MSTFPAIKIFKLNVVFLMYQEPWRAADFDEGFVNTLHGTFSSHLPSKSLPSLLFIQPSAYSSIS